MFGCNLFQKFPIHLIFSFWYVRDIFILNQEASFMFANYRLSPKNSKTTTTVPLFKNCLKVLGFPAKNNNMCHEEW